MSPSAQLSRVLPYEPSLVFTEIIDWERHKLWQPSLSSASGIAADNGIVVEARSVMGQTVRFSFEITEFRKNRLIVAKSTANKFAPAKQSYTLAPHEEGCALEMYFELGIPSHLAMFSSFFIPEINREVRLSLDNLTVLLAGGFIPYPTWRPQ